MKMQLQLDIYKGVPREMASIKLKKERKTHEDAITTWYIQGSPEGNGQDKIQEDYEALAQWHGGTKKGVLQPKGGISSWEPNEK